MSENLIIKNMEKGIEIAKKYNLKLFDQPAIEVIKNKTLASELIRSCKYARKKHKGGYKTFCGQLTSRFFLDLGYDMRPFLGKKKPNDVNTTTQYKNAIKNKVLQVTMEEAFYLINAGRPCLILSPYYLHINGHHYNHAAGTWPIRTEVYNPEIGPYIFQEGWHALIGEPISDNRSWGIVWKNEMVKCFVPDFK